MLQKSPAASAFSTVAIAGNQPRGGSARRRNTQTISGAQRA
jgi:hypothetical protein